MNHYQTTFILNPVLSKEAVSGTVKGFLDLLSKEKAVEVHQSESKLKDLAYPIKKIHAGIYVDIAFKAPSSVVAQLETRYSRDEHVLRFLTTKVDRHGLAYKEEKSSSASSEKKIESKAGEDVVGATQDQHTKKKYCRFRRFGIKYIDYKNENFLKSFLNPQGKILPRRLTGTSAKYQRKVARSVKRARILALLPFVTDNFK